jgi:hypothetical protein
VLILDYDSIRSAALADALTDLGAQIARLPRHGVLASTWFAHQRASLEAGTDARLRRALDSAGIVWLNEMSNADDCSNLLQWQGRLVPREGPDAGRDADAACALAYAQSRGAVAVLSSSATVEIAATVSPKTKTLWLPALLDHLVQHGMPAADAALMLKRLVEEGGADWDSQDLSAVPWRDA